LGNQQEMGKEARRMIASSGSGGRQEKGVGSSSAASLAATLRVMRRWLPTKLPPEPEPLLQLPLALTGNVAAGEPVAAAGAAALLVRLPMLPGPSCSDGPRVGMLTLTGLPRRNASSSVLAAALKAGGHLWWVSGGTPLVEPAAHKHPQQATAGAASTWHLQANTQQGY